MIKAVFFDLDGTLYDRDAFVADLFSYQFEVFRAELDGVGKDQFVQRLLELENHGYGSKLKAYRQAAEEWGAGPELAARLLEHFWSDYDGRCKVDPATPKPRLPDDTRTTLETLQEHRKKLEFLRISSVFDTVLISGSEGVRKPESEIFHRALERCGVEQGEALFVGDHPEVDVAGAKRAGLVAVWRFVPYWTLTTDNVPTVHRLAEILPLCLNDQ